MPLTARQRSIHNKNGAKRAASFNKGKRTRKGSEGEYLVTNAPSDLRSISYPGGAVALMLLLTVRLASAYWGQIADCDETYNYWEPLHFLVYGNGLQTWEYSPAYALRSYMALWMFAVPAKMLSYVMTPANVFYTLRGLLAVLTACSELMFYKAVCHEFGVHVGRVWLALAAGGAGCWAAAASMLPAAWSASLAAAALACWWRRRYAPAVLATAASALLSWPFTAILGVPIAIDMLLIKQKYQEFIKWSVISLVIIMVPMVAVDSWHYGRLVIAPWNIVAYNILTEHGPDLYGVEPWTYYFVNGFLNFNVVWVVALSSPLLLVGCALISARSTARAHFCSPYWLDLMPLFLWLMVFMLQPHKEERFLYPVYSMILLAGAIGLDCLQKMTFAVATELFRRQFRGERKHYLLHTGPIAIMFVLVATLAGVSRMAALYTNYHSPMTILSALPPAPPGAEEAGGAGSAGVAGGRGPRWVCFGAEWHRSPSSFLTPPGYRIRFIPSDFDGQMPAPYREVYDATRIVHSHFNDQNKGDNSTYIPASQCHYLVDSDVVPTSPSQPPHHRSPSWEVVTKAPLLDAKKSHQIFRAFYVPVLSERHNVFGNLYLLKNKLLV